MPFAKGCYMAGTMKAAGQRCSRCLRAQSLWSFPESSPATTHRSFSLVSPLTQAAASEKQDGSDHKQNDGASEREEGAMSRRLSEMTEQSMEEGGRSARKTMEEAGFSEELKKQLEERIAESTFRSQNAAAISQVEMPSSAGQGTRDQAAAQPWTGSESLEDAALRMLTDSNKPLRTPSKIPRPRGMPSNVSVRPSPKPKVHPGERLASARDRTSIYALSQNPAMSEKEREQMRKELKERFTPGARPMPTTLQGLASLANERIEDAIARGQFKNIPRGKGKNIERDRNFSNPFLDTTEYFMNKIIQKQEIVPPWIEKQQELVKAADVFRKRLRAEWRRHAARVIASQGGNLQAQIRRARGYAQAEALLNPKKPKVEALSEIDAEGRLSQVVVKETPPPPEQELLQEEHSPTTTITVTESLASAPYANTDPTALQLPPAPSEPSNQHHQIPNLPPFRDPTWERTESAYHSLAINSLNSQARSYNLMAPAVAQKPYFSLSRELSRCFADVAPELPMEIERRARAPERVRVEVVGHRPGGVMEKFGAGEKVKVWDERRPSYGFKEFWRDLWNKEEGVKA